MSFALWLTLLFICLKLTNNIDWNWFFVLLPFILKIMSDIGEELSKNE